MMTLYYTPGAVSMAAHVVLEEIGVPYERKPIQILQNEQRGAAYLAINPRGQVPALVVDGTVITETAAVLNYLGRTFPQARLLPSNDLDQARCMATLCWIASQ